MLNKVIFCCKDEAVSQHSQADWSVISIGEPWGLPAVLLPSWHSVLRLEFFDSDGDQAEAGLFSAKHARQIIRFVDQVEVQGITGILVHCHAGISRSAAVAKWVAETRKLPFNENYHIYNRLVYRILTDLGKYLEWNKENKGDL